MATDKRFTIEVRSSYEGFWRYNVAMTCGCFDSEGRRTGFATASSQLAEVGANRSESPAGAHDRRIELHTDPCAAFDCFLYVIPHTLPADNDIAATRTFPLEVVVRADGRTLRRERYAINPWSGASIELRSEEESSQPAVYQ